MRSVLEDISALLTDACALELTLVEFHDTSISMLMISSISSARLRKSTLALFGMSLEYPRYNDGQHQQRKKLYSFHVRGAVRRREEEHLVLYRSHKSYAYSGSPGVCYGCSFEEHIMNRDASRIDHADNPAKIGAHVSTY